MNKNKSIDTNVNSVCSSVKESCQFAFGVEDNNPTLTKVNKGFYAANLLVGIAEGAFDAITGSPFNGAPYTPSKGLIVSGTLATAQAATVLTGNIASEMKHNYFKSEGAVSGLAIGSLQGLMSGSGSLLLNRAGYIAGYGAVIAKDFIADYISK